MHRNCSFAHLSSAQLMSSLTMSICIDDDSIGARCRIELDFVGNTVEAIASQIILVAQFMSNCSNPKFSWICRECINTVALVHLSGALVHEQPCIYLVMDCSISHGEVKDNESGTTYQPPLRNALQKNLHRKPQICRSFSCIVHEQPLYPESSLILFGRHRKPQLCGSLTCIVHEQPLFLELSLICSGTH